jgi:hypothetical protein
MNREEKLHIAKEAYRAIKAAIDDVESYKDARVNCLWPGYISVDGTVFAPDELRNADDQGN